MIPDMGGKPQYYRLIGQTPVPCTVEEWATNFSREDRRVLLTRIGPFEVSTVFLGLNHNFWDEGPPILFETLTFLDAPEGGNFVADARARDFEGNNLMDGRDSTWLDAEARHRRAVAWMQEHYCAATEQPLEIIDATTAKEG